MNKVKYINPIIGTVSEVTGYFHGGGKTHPGACTPRGMVQLSPDTVTGGDNGSGYNYCMDTIEGFSFNHLSGVGWYGDLGNLQVMPVVGECDLRSGSNKFTPLKNDGIGWKSNFSHEKEVATAGYYSVMLERYNVLAEATVKHHSGMLRFTYPKSDNSKVIFNLSRRIGGHSDFQYAEIIGTNKLIGWIKCTPEGGGFGMGAGGIRYTLHFCCEFSKPAKSIEFFSDEMVLPKTNKIQGEDIGVLVSFDTEENEQILIKTGISYVDIEGAENNLKEEIEGFDFDEIKLSAEKMWEEAISVVDVDSDNEEDKEIFYSCLYHSLLDPRINVDVDGRYSDAVGQISHTSEYTPLTVFSGWDVYRSEFPLLTVISPNTVNDEVNSLIDIAEKTASALPRWELLGINSGCMVGDPGVIVTADAYIKGIRNYDVDMAYKIAKAGCLGEKTLDGKPFNPIREEAADLNELGYVPNSLSRTLEDLFADYTLSRFALSLNKVDDAKLFEERSMWYKKSFNKKTGFMGPIDRNGEFIEVSDEYDETGCVESNILQQSWFVPYDIVGLVELFGRERFEKLLETFFEKADLKNMWNVEYNHSNEPCHHVAYLFNYIDRPERTQYWVRRVQKEAYNTGAFGFCGNEDVGQLSAWYVLSAIGFGQTCPSVPEYQINTPLFRNITIKLNEIYHSCNVADSLKICCDKDPLENPYISEVILNGCKLNRNYLTYNEITSGGILELVLKKSTEV